MNKPLPNEALQITRALPPRMATCPACKAKDLVWKTKDAQGPFLGLVNCPACGWTKTRQDFLAVDWPAYKKAYH